MDEEEKKQKRIQMMASYAMLPFVLAIPPIVGWYLGSWLDDRFDLLPYGRYGLLILGTMSGIRECYRIVKKYKDEEI